MDTSATAAEAGALLAGAADWGEALARPMRVVRTPPAQPPPTSFPSVLVVADLDGGDHLPVGADLALTQQPGAPAPWVTVPDIDVALETLAGRVAGAPAAAVTLIQLLRLGRRLPLVDAIALESLAYSVLQAGPEFARWLAGRPRPGRQEGSGDEVICRRSGNVLSITLNRPAVHNAYNRRMRDLLCDCLSVAVADPECRVDWRGAGPSFCSGGDLDEFGTAPDPATANLVRTARSPARLLAAIGSRVEVTLHGSCAGSGVELPAFAARIKADPSTRIWLPELEMGLIPGAGGTASLPRRIGRHRFAWLALSGQVIDAGRALSWGLVDEIIDDHRIGWRPPQD